MFLAPGREHDSPGLGQNTVMSDLRQTGWLLQRKSGVCMSVSRIEIAIRSLYILRPAWHGTQIVNQSETWL